jgi:hypothetical protein
MPGATLTAPAFLSGLSDAELNVVRERARIALHPEQAQMQQHLGKSLDDLRGGLDAARGMVRERCQMDEDDDGQSRSISEPLPVGARAAATAAMEDGLLSS